MHSGLCARRVWSALGSALTLSLVAGAPALADPLLPGTSLVPVIGEPDPTGGTTVAWMSQPFNSPGFYSGTLTSVVISGDPSNPYGGLTFVYIINNEPTSRHSLGRLTVNGYGGFLVDASFKSPVALGDTAPAIADRDAVGDMIGFSFFAGLNGSNRVLPGGVSAMLVLQTNATSWTDTFASVINGNVVTVPTFSPVPGPGAAALGVIGLAAASRRRRR